MNPLFVRLARTAKVPGYQLAIAAVLCHQSSPLLVPAVAVSAVPVLVAGHHEPVPHLVVLLEALLAHRHGHVPRRVVERLPLLRQMVQGLAETAHLGKLFLNQLFLSLRHLKSATCTAIAQLALDVIAGDWVDLYRAPGPRERIAIRRAVGELLAMVTEWENAGFFAFLTLFCV